MPNWLKTILAIILTLVFSWNTFGPGSREEPIPDEIETEAQPTYSFRSCGDCGTEVPENFLFKTHSEDICPECFHDRIGPLELCNFCDNEVPGQYMYDDHGDNVCPECVYDSTDMFTSGEYATCHHCGYAYDRTFSYGFGLCDSCGSDLLAECVFCYEYTYKWPGCDWFAACPDCLSNAYRNSDLEAVLLRYFERE